MKRKLLFLILLALLCSIGNAWADDTYYLQSTTSAGTLSTDGFYTTAPCTQDVTVSYGGVNYTKAVKLGGNVSDITSNNYPNRMIRYDCKTDDTEFTIIAYTSKSGKTFCVGDIQESAIGSENTVTTYTSVSATQNDKTEKTYSIKSSRPASLFVSTGNSSDVYIVQIIAVEKGNALPTPGAIGYSVNFKKHRFVARSNTAATLDGFFEINPYGNHTAASDGQITIYTKGTNYVKFNAETACQVDVAISEIGSSKGFYLADDKNATVNASTLQNSGAKTYSFEVSAGDHYLVPNGGNIKITSISFTDIPTKYSVSYNLNTGTGTTPTETDKTEGTVFTLHDGTTGITAPSGKQFAGWLCSADGLVKAASSEYTMTATATTFTAQWENLKCATPTITIGAFNFENKGYAVTITNNETGSTLKYSTDNETWNVYTGTLYATSTTHYYAKSVMDDYEDSDVADKNVTNTFDGGKSYIAWVYKDGYSSASVAYDFDTDPMVVGLSATYNVVPVALADNDKPYTNRATDGYGINNADLVVCSEAVTGDKNLSNDMEGFVGTMPMLNLKFYNYGASTDGSKRWAWGKPANNTTTYTITPESSTYKILNGVIFEDGAIRVFESTAPKDNKVQTVDWTSEPGNNVNMGTANSKTAMHAIIDDENLDKQFFAIGLTRDNASSYSANAVTIIKNVAAILIAGTERLDATVSSVSKTISDAGWATYCSSYALDFSSAIDNLDAAYIVTGGADGVLTKTAVSTTVPANTGLLLKGEGVCVIPVVASSSTDVSANKLVGKTAEFSLAANSGYVLLNETTGEARGIGFYINTSAAFTVGANTAYLPVGFTGSTPDAAPSLFRIVEEENNATAIEDLKAGEETVKFIENGILLIKKNGVVYDVTGRVIR